MKETKKIILAVIVFLILLVIIIGVLIVRIAKVTNTIADDKKTNENNNISSNTTVSDKSTNNTQNEITNVKENENRTNIINTPNTNRKIEEAEELVETLYSEKPEPVTNEAYSNIVYRCIMESLNSMYLISSNNEVDSQEAIKETYYRLSENCKKQNNITLDNLKSKMSNLRHGDFVKNVEILQQYVENNRIIRYVSRNKFLENGNEYYLNFILYLDYNNLTYAIEPIDSSITNLEEVNLKVEIENIPENDYNQYRKFIITKAEE